MFGVLDRWNERDFSGVVVKSGDDERWLNCNPLLLKNLLSSGAVRGDEVYYELNERYKSKLKVLWLRKVYDDMNKRETAEQIGEKYKEETITAYIPETQALPLISVEEAYAKEESEYRNKTLIILERIAKALERLNE